MWRAICAVTLLVLSWAGSASGESIYQTLPPRPQSSFGANTSFVFMAPYITRVETTLSASISKSSGSGNSANSGNSQNSASKAQPPQVSYADFIKDDKGNTLIQYWVSCDLRSVLHPTDKILVSGMKPDNYNVSTPATVRTVKPGLLVISAPDNFTKNPPTSTGAGGVIQGANFDNCPTAGDAFTVTLTVSPTPLSRGYLYLRRNAFFDDNVDFSVGTDGMLTNSDTSSTQEITAILNELAQTAAAAGLKVETADVQKTLDSVARPECYNAISDRVQTMPFYDTVAFEKIADVTVNGFAPDSKAVIKPSQPVVGRNGVVGRGSRITWTIPINTLSNGDTVSVRFTLQTRINSYNQAVDKEQDARSFGGFVAFFPVAATARVECLVVRQGTGGADPTTSSFLLSPPTMVNLYTESHFLNPQRDFFTNPHDTFTFTSGLITSHKFTGQSAAKTVIDTITGPIRSLLPSVTVTQSVAVSPTSKTTTTSTQTAPPKGP